MMGVMLTALLMTLQGACVRDYHYTVIRNPCNVTASAHLWMHVCTDRVSQREERHQRCTG